MGGSDPEPIERSSWTDLHKAAADKNVEAVAKLIRAGCNVDVRDKDGRTPLHCASERGLARCVELLIKLKADVNAADKFGATALHFASQRGSVDCVRALIKSGATVCARNSDDSTPLDLAREGDHEECAEVLIGNGGYNNYYLDIVRVQDPVAIKSTALPSGHIFISYCHADKRTVYPIVDKLTTAGYSVWIDKNDIKSNILAEVAENIEKASLVLLFYSYACRNSKNCEMEVTYAVTRQKAIIPVRVERDYMPDGWLGFVIGANLYYDFGNQYNFDEKFEVLKKAIDDTIASLKQSIRQSSAAKAGQSASGGFSPTQVATSSQQGDLFDASKYVLSDISEEEQLARAIKESLQFTDQTVHTEKGQPRSDMSTNSITEQETFDEFYTCSVCLEYFIEPKSLPCLHNFCKECLEEIILRIILTDSFPCPICQAPTPVVCSDKQGIDCFKTNFLIQSLMEKAGKNLAARKARRKKVVCKACEEEGQTKVAVAKCEDCCELLCQQCADAHRITRMTKRHVINEIISK